MEMEAVAEKIALPIDHWSYSSLTLFLRNRLAFKKKYIMKIYDDLYGPSAVVGSACHKALQNFYNGGTVEDSIQVGMNYINIQSDTGINYGKTGSRGNILLNYSQAINHYFAEQPSFNEILGVEKSIVTFIKTRDGQELAVPAKSYTDLIVRNDDGGLDIVDYKFVTSFSDGDKDRGIYVLQALFNFHTIEAEFKESPQRMIFLECKIGKNKDGTPQIQPYTIEFAKQPEFFDLFYNIYNDCTREISKPDVMYLPNFQDAFDGDNTFEAYKSQVITVENPIAVQHKMHQLDFVERKFIQSAPGKTENEFLVPEEKIRMKLQEFGLPVEMQETYTGASVIQYTFKPSRGLKMSQFDKHDKDLALVLKAKTIRMEAPIMGTDTVGVEVPNPERKTIQLNLEFQKSEGLVIPIGTNVYGHVVYKDIAEMPHLLIAGTTGSGKSVMINTIIKVLTEQNLSEDLKLVLIDPKRVELSQYKNLPHLLAPVIFDEDKASKTLAWLVEEMEVRYDLLERGGYRLIDEYNADQSKKMPKIVVIIDEYADLMLQSEDNHTEKAIIRLAQKARAIGIHLILGTQRPSVDVVTGLIKANFPTRIAFMTTSGTDSRIILDQGGAEELLGKGDMLFLDPTVRGLQRLQGFYI